MFDPFIQDDARLVSLLRGVNLNDHCSWCHYMSCVPTSRWSCDTYSVLPGELSIKVMFFIYFLFEN
ncbi:putative peptidase S54, rhomboid [Helianthus annuus]|nr:putative peptidase S54, rhomboid [Helianthus annuus]KAJ0662647.1 putative peptidase S54, rhomboid [Helianthus annuus]KAJ0670160.1 putative peptidase S54, rhomboid [Helianthus annuus]